MDEVNVLVEASRLLREAADDVHRFEPVQSSQLRNAMLRLEQLGFSRTFVARQIADWLEQEAEAVLAGEPALSAALAVAEKIRRES